MKTGTVLIGLGNPLLRDEGIGVHLERALAASHAKKTSGLGSFSYPQPVEFLDLGTASFRVLHAIAGKARALFIDCALMEEAPGTLRRFTLDEVRTRKSLPQLSLHEGDLLHTLDLAQKIEECPPTVVIFGIQPEDISPGEALSPALTASFAEYVRAIEEEINFRNQ